MAFYSEYITCHPCSRNDHVLTQLSAHKIRITDLPNRKATAFELVPTAEERSALAGTLDILGIKKLRFTGTLVPVGKGDWQLNAELGATVVQPCVVTLDPVTTRIDEAVTRTYLADVPEAPTGETEMPEDDTEEALPEVLDLATVMEEALSLALPAYPRSEGAELGEAVFAESGVAPMRDDDAKPFAGLASLRDSLENKGE